MRYLIFDENKKHLVFLTQRVLSDRLENTFGVIRILMGSSFLMSVYEVLLADKKLKALAVVKLYGEQSSQLSFKEHMDNFRDDSDDTALPSDMIQVNPNYFCMNE